MNQLMDYPCPDCAHRGPHYPAGAHDEDGYAMYGCGDCNAEFTPRVAADGTACPDCEHTMEVHTRMGCEGCVCMRRTDAAPW